MTTPGQTHGSEGGLGTPRSTWRSDTGRLHLQKLNHPCLQTLQGPLSSYFDEPTLEEKYPSFRNLTPREKALSPRIPRALHHLYEKPEADMGLVHKWMRGLPKNEQLLRKALAEKIPGTSDPPCSPRRPVEPVEKLQQLRKDQAQQLNVLIKKVAPSKNSEDPVMQAARVKLARLEEPVQSPLEPLQEQSQEEVAPQEDGSGETPAPQEADMKVLGEESAKDEFAWSASQQRSL
eukprot:CAMPEP_0197668840 /NCGR_PEP_ID=MMETSP1338-20131121/70415_1 /TAXON_ID=43686 ORGANISM="Pelagodinium beii, Strain RCC1491" /NCGR_SAMPLE_ID=MMETSP1338 /ASSEMBLY_ACC=CAM_ASM_000754 /LENGTH=233 /DNA_ID=CAMNT_0043248295 /DNA_START=6 /DNA_END=707 /DNA_ORIENTATION=+